MPIDVEYGPAPSLEGYAAAYGAGGQAAMQGQEQLDKQQAQMHQQRMQEAQFQASQLPSPRDVFHQQAQMQSMVGHAQLQALVHGTQLSQQESMRLQKLQNTRGAILADDTLKDDEKAQYLRYIDAGVDPLLQRLQQTQLAKMQADVAQQQQHTKTQAQNAAMLQNLFTQGTSQVAGSGEAPEYEGSTAGQPRIKSFNPQTGAFTFDHTDDVVAQRREAAQAALAARRDQHNQHAVAYSALHSSAAQHIETQMQKETTDAYHATTQSPNGVAALQRPWMSNPQLREQEAARRLSAWEQQHSGHPGHPENAPGMAEMRQQQASQSAAALNQALQATQAHPNLLPRERTQMTEALQMVQQIIARYGGSMDLRRMSPQDAAFVQGTMAQYAEFQRRG